MKQLSFNVPDRSTGDFITLRDVVEPIWEARKEFLAIVLLVMACVGAWVGLNVKYRSEGFFQFGGPIPIPAPKEKNEKNPEKEPDAGITLSDFKRYGASFSTSERFFEYVHDKKLESTEGIDDLRRVIARDGISRLIEPIYPFTKLDAKDLMEQPKGSSNNVIALRIKYDASSPLVAQQMVGLIGNYAMDSIVFLIYSDQLRFKHDEISTKIIRLDNTIIENKTRLDELARRSEELKQIIARNPGSEGQAARQVVTITEENAHYLPPATQLLTAEVQAAEAKEKIYHAKREQEQNKLYLEYFDRAKAILNGTKSGETVLRGLEEAKLAVFKDKNMDDDIVKEVYNKITVDNRSAINVYLDKSRFIAGPTLSDKPTVRMPIAMALALIAGLIIAVLFVFIRKWIRQNMSSRPTPTQVNGL